MYKCEQNSTSSLHLYPTLHHSNGNRLSCYQDTFQFSVKTLDDVYFDPSFILGLFVCHQLSGVRSRANEGDLHRKFPEDEFPPDWHAELLLLLLDHEPPPLDLRDSGEGSQHTATSSCPRKRLEAATIWIHSLFWLGLQYCWLGSTIPGLLQVKINIIHTKGCRNYCEAQGKGRAKGRPRKVTQRSFIDWWIVDGGYPFPDALH